ncbi:hypothetical protein [Microbispora sp. H10836]|uniref:hypothetical protein n=1 Tax=Microbispora sp. H10836 TaxID=2729106 RepID=UPI001B8BA769|nr:hypothetical protein [Microbispora sp. H10836]
MATEHLQEDGKLYELLSYYCVPDDAWSVELTELGERQAGLVHVLLPDEDADRPCEVLQLSGDVPVGVLRRVIEEVANLARHAGVTLERTRTAAPD